MFGSRGALLPVWMRPQSLMPHATHNLCHVVSPVDGPEGGGVGATERAEQEEESDGGENRQGARAEAEHEEVSSC